MFDRTGELPEDARPLRSKPKPARVVSGLAAVDLLPSSGSTREASRNSSTSRFNEYVVDDDDGESRPASTGPPASEGSGKAGSPEQQDVPAVAEVEVVRVKRKKKKKPVE